MNRKSTSIIFSIIVLVAMMFSAFGMVTPATAAAGDYTLTIAPKNVNAGDVFTMDVVLDEAAGASLAGWQFSLAWDPTVARLVSWTEDKSCLNAAALVAGGDTFRVAGTINNTVGTLSAAAVSSLAFPGGLISATNCKIANLTFQALANGKATLTMNPVILYNGALALVPASDIVINANFIQVGPAPALSVSSVAFSATSPFTATVTVANTAATAYPGGDPLNYSLTDATGGNPVSPITLPAIGANSSHTFTISGLEIATGKATGILTITIPAFGQSRSDTFSFASDEGTTPVDATFGAFIEITPDSAVNFGKLGLGGNSVTGNLNVKCNTNYQVDVKDNNPTAWHMTEYNGTAFQSKSLIETMHIASAQSNVTAGTPAMLVVGGVAGQSGDAGQNFPLTYSQVLRYADPLLSAGSTYHLVLTFNGYVTL